MALDSDFDDRVRTVLDPDPGVIDRMVSTALRQARAPRPRATGTLRLALAGAAVLACALYLTWPQVPPPIPPDDFVLTRAGDLVLIESASGEAWILGPAAAPDPAKTGTGFVIVEGEPK